LPFWGGERTILKRDAMLIRVTADNGDGPVGPVAFREHTSGRPGQRNSELRCEELAVGQSANAVGAEQTSRAQDQRLLY